MGIESVGRRGKYILIHLSSDVALVVHLGMTGQLRLLDEVAPLEKHTHAVFFLDDGRQLRYRDPRRFGRLLVGSEEALLTAKKMPRLGRSRSMRAGRPNSSIASCVGAGRR